jgi:hypothetical protein
MIARLQRLFGFCQHGDLYREHREIGGRLVACFVCPCGFVRPVIERTDEEYAHLDRVAAPARSRRG